MRILNPISPIVPLVATSVTAFIGAAVCAPCAEPVGEIELVGFTNGGCVFVAA